MSQTVSRKKTISKLGNALEHIKTDSVCCGQTVTVIYSYLEHYDPSSELYPLLGQRDIATLKKLIEATIEIAYQVKADLLTFEKLQEELGID